MIVIWTNKRQKKCNDFEMKDKCLLHRQFWSLYISKNLNAMLLGALSVGRVTDGSKVSGIKKTNCKDVQARILLKGTFTLLKFLHLSDASPSLGRVCSGAAPWKDSHNWGKLYWEVPSRPSLHPLMAPDRVIGVCTEVSATDGCGSCGQFLFLAWVFALGSPP